MFENIEIIAGDGIDYSLKGIKNINIGCPQKTGNRSCTMRLLGARGMSNYELWLLNGNKGTLEDYLANIGASQPTSIDFLAHYILRRDN